MKDSILSIDSFNIQLCENLSQIKKETGEFLSSLKVYFILI